jgi:hypothetical protein
MCSFFCTTTSGSRNSAKGAPKPFTRKRCRADPSKHSRLLKVNSRSGCLILLPTCEDWPAAIFDSSGETPFFQQVRAIDGEPTAQIPLSGGSNQPVEQEAADVGVPFEIEDVDDLGGGLRKGVADARLVLLRDEGQERAVGGQQTTDRLDSMDDDHDNFPNAI